MMLDGVMDVVFSRAKAVSVVGSRGSGKKERSRSKWSTRGGVTFLCATPRVLEKVTVSAPDRWVRRKLVELGDT